MSSNHSSMESVYKKRRIDNICNDSQQTQRISSSSEESTSHVSSGTTLRLSDVCTQNESQMTVSSSATEIGEISQEVPQNEESTQISGYFGGESDKKCNECKDNFGDNKVNGWAQFIKCSDSNCGKYYHLGCAQIEPKLYTLIQNSKTIKWICNNCSDPHKPLLNIF